MATATAEKSTEVNEEAEQTWKTFVNLAKKAGFREGAADGREELFQENFNLGYSEGFKIAYATGKYKGALKALTKPESDEPLLQNLKSASCQICADESLLNHSNLEIMKRQTEFSNNLLEMLHQKYANICCTSLEKNVENYN